MGNLLVEIEKRGVPGVLESWDVPDLKRIAKDAFRLKGVPECRQVWTPPDPGITDISEYAQDFIDALTVPRTAEEAASGIYTPLTQPRILMTGTYDEVQAYFEGDLSRYPPTADQGPIAFMTDGLPIVPPTEERVASMLTGTSHAPDEILNVYHRGSPQPYMTPKEWQVTVEKVAINAVMAGCKPEYLPVVLAISELAPPVSYPGDSSNGRMYVVSGPIGKEIGMNSFFCNNCPGNPANQSIGRAATLVGINGGGVEMGLTNANRHGDPIWDLTFAEATDRSPWEGINEEEGYGADESVLLACSAGVYMIPMNTGEVPTTVATNLDEVLVSTPEIVSESIKVGRKAMGSFVMFTPDTAEKWKNDYGFETIQELQDWLWDNSTWSVGELKSWYWSYSWIAQIEARERGSRMINPDHLDLPDDAQIPVLIDGPEAIKIIVTGGDGDGWSFGGAMFSTISIDKWR